MVNSVICVTEEGIGSGVLCLLAINCMSNHQFLPFKLSNAANFQTQWFAGLRRTIPNKNAVGDDAKSLCFTDTELDAVYSEKQWILLIKWSVLTPSKSRYYIKKKPNKQNYKPSTVAYYSYLCVYF